MGYISLSVGLINNDYYWNYLYIWFISGLECIFKLSRLDAEGKEANIREDDPEHELSVFDDNVVQLGYEEFIQRSELFFKRFPLT